MKNIVILISGRGSNMAAIVRAARDEAWPARIAAVIANRDDAPGLEFARAQGIPTVVVPSKNFIKRIEFDFALQRTIDTYCPDVLVLAGFMRILGTSFVTHYAGRIINIHPSLLPAFTGLNTHRQALEAGVKVHGASVHFVTHELDHGPIIAQGILPVLPKDNETSLAARILQLEHKLYVLAIRWLLEDKLHLHEGHCYHTDGVTQALIEGSI